MKKLLFILATVLTGTTVNAQDFSKMDKSPLDFAYYPSGAVKRARETDAAKKKALEPQIRVTYSRPYKNDRVVFGELLPYGTPWRVGANETSEILFLNNVYIGGKKVKAGRYSMIIIPNETEWTLKLSTDLDGWGVYNYDESNDIASITVPISSVNSEVIENLSISLYEASEKTVHLKIGWDTTVAEFPITLK